GQHGLAPLLVGYADDGAFAHCRVRVHGVLHLARVDVLAAADDHVLDAVDDVDEAVLVHPGAVAGVHPAVADHGGRGLGIAPVAQHHLRTAHRDLARHAARQLVPVGVDDLHIHPVGHTTGCLALVRSMLAV